jgi:nitrous oxide reductase
MADVLVYKVSVGPAVDKDVVERQLLVAVNGAEPVDAAKVFSADATDLGEVRVKQDDKVLLTLVDVDDAGNRSEPAVLEFVASDTLPPAQPGAFGVTLVAEVEEEVEVEEDEGEEPAAPETPVEPEAPADEA